MDDPEAVVGGDAERLAHLHVVPVWDAAETQRLVQRQHEVRERPTRWRWVDLHPELLGAANRRVGPGEADRRILAMRNAGATGPVVAATPTLSGSLQMILPGEIAAAHRHSYSAIRFVLSGRGARTTVEGEELPMNERDLLLTPNGMWHDHVGGDEPVIWFDGLDFPFTLGMRAAFQEDPPAGHVQADGIPRSDRAWPDSFSPQALFRWADVWPELERRLADPLDPHEGATVAYANPVTGGPILPTLAARLHGLPAGFRTEARRQTASSLVVVVEGEGRSVIDGHELHWGPRDVLAEPAWAWREYEATTDAVLFRLTDEPLLEPFSLHRTEALATGDGHQEVLVPDPEDARARP